MNTHKSISKFWPTSDDLPPITIDLRPKRCRRKSQHKINKRKRKQLSYANLNPPIKDVRHFNSQFKVKRVRLGRVTPFNSGLETKLPKLNDTELVGEITKLQGLIKQVRLKTLAETVTHLKRTQYHEPLASSLINFHSKQTKKTQRAQRAKLKKVTPPLYDLELALEDHINKIIQGNEPQPPNYCEKPLIYHRECNLGDFARLCVQAGVGRIVEGNIKVNPRNYHEANITLESGFDAKISSMAARMYALDGDIVKVFIRNTGDGYLLSKPECDEYAESIEDLEITREENDTDYTLDVKMLKDTNVINCSSLLRHAFVIGIVKERGNRIFVGTIRFRTCYKINNMEYYKFHTLDPKLPTIYVTVAEWLKELSSHNPDDRRDFLYTARVTRVETNGRYFGELKTCIGNSGIIEDEVQAILMNNQINELPNYDEISDDVLNIPVNITEHDMLDRDDLRDECIFTIHSPTDFEICDAVSCKSMDKHGLYEIGIHIADVSHFLQENTKVDTIARQRAESVYLVNKVIHMLPDELSKSCSLDPGAEKLSFSIFWIMTEKAKILSTRFAKCIIRSCARLTYEDAHRISTFPNKVFNGDDLPKVCNGFRLADICTRVKILNSVAEILRRKRLENGSLYIEKPKFLIQVDNNTGEPISCRAVEKNPVHYMMKEFLIQANQSVAHLIYKRLPDISFLRRQAPPQPCGIRKLKAKLTTANLFIDMSTSKSIQRSRDRICLASHKPEIMLIGLNYWLSKPMQTPKYFCGGTVATSDELHHYSLALPIYVHFTNPIGRYADIIVHRLLSCAINFSAIPSHSINTLNDIAEVCNVRKLKAKKTAEDCARFYFERYVNMKKFLNVRGVVVRISKNSMDVLIVATGYQLTIPYKSQPVLINADKAPHMVTVVERNSVKNPQELRIFSVVKLKLKMCNRKLIGILSSPDKDQRIKNAIAESKMKCIYPEMKILKPQVSANGKRLSSKATSKKSRLKSGKKRNLWKKEKLLQLTSPC